jgi:hypothetical protein
MADHTSGWLLTVVGLLGVYGGAIINGAFNNYAHQSDLDAKMIELSIGILRAPPTPETTPLREWAIDVINKRGNFSFNKAQRDTLLKRELPFKGGWEKELLYPKELFSPAPKPGVVCGLADKQWTCPPDSNCGPGGSCVVK